MAVSSDEIFFTPQWFAVWTKSRQEKSAAAILESFGVPYFLPCRTELRTWSDRKQQVEVPLFSGYLFVYINAEKESRLRVLNTSGIVGLVGNHNGPVPIPSQQIESIRTVLSKRVDFTVPEYLEEGDLVRVIRGSLAGVEGRLVKSNSIDRLVISVEMINKCISVSVSRKDVELLDLAVA